MNQAPNCILNIRNRSFRAQRRNHLNPHYSLELLLFTRIIFEEQRVPGIRGCDKPACGYCCRQAGGLVTQSLNVLFQYASVLRGSTRPSRYATPRFRDEPS